MTEKPSSSVHYKTYSWSIHLWIGPLTLPAKLTIAMDTCNASCRSIVQDADLAQKSLSSLMRYGNCDFKKFRQDVKHANFDVYNIENC